MKTSAEASNKKGMDVPYQELLILKGTNHLHQTDVIVLDPLLSFVKSGMWPHGSINEIYLLNSQVVLKFLDAIGFQNSFNVKDIQVNIDKHKEKRIEPVYNSVYQTAGQ